MKKITLIIFLFLSVINKAQTKYDTISFDHLLVKNHILYTKFNYFKNYVDDSKTKAKVFTGKDIKIPFRNFSDNVILYTIFSDNLVFSYEETKDNDLFITYIKPTKDLDLKLIINKNNCLLLNHTLTVSKLKKYFKNSYTTSIKNKKDFRLVVKDGNKYAYCDLVFKDQHFVELYLLTE